MNKELTNINRKIKISRILYIIGGKNKISDIKRNISFSFVVLISFTLLIPIASTISINNPLEISHNQTYVSIFEKNLTNLKTGDIVFKFPDVFPKFFPKIIDHCLLFVEFDNSTGMYVFIEANVPNAIVQYVYENESSLNEFPYGPVARVKNANEAQILNAIDFAKKQIGKAFQMIVINKNYNPEDINDHYANQWYCSELIWAAYYNCNNSFPESEPQQGYVYGEGIDLDLNGWNKNLLNIQIVFPREILLNRKKVSVYYLNDKTNIDNYFMNNEKIKQS